MTEKTFMAMIVILAGEESRELYLPVVALWEHLFFSLTAPLEQIVSRAADLLIVDCGFQSERGLHLLQELKSRCPGAPIIFLTDTSSEELAIGAFRAGAREYFRKPVDASELLETVHHLLQLKRGATEKRGFSRVRGNEQLPGSDLPSGTELPENLRRAVRYIEENISCTISLEAIAREACVSKYHFCRVFRRHLKMSPMSYVTHMRMERAKRLLGKSMSVSAVALKSGFNDLSSFIHHFKRVTGLTPTAFRSSLKR